jgi:UDP-N-acetylmuramoylalanine--D-glutamate ligase
VIGVDEAEGRYLANQLGEGPQDDRVIRVSVKGKLEEFGWSVVARKGFLAEWRKGRQVASIDLRGIRGLPGAHNHQNACAAYAVARALGLPPKLIGEAFATFEGLPHRSQVVAEKDGVLWVNDSKATNADSAAQALMAYDRIRWIVGGQMKDGGLAPLVPHLGRVVKAYVIGRAAREIALTIAEVPHEVCETMEVAVARAAAEARRARSCCWPPRARASTSTTISRSAARISWRACARSSAGLRTPEELADQRLLAGLLPGALREGR